MNKKLFTVRPFPVGSPREFMIRIPQQKTLYLSCFATNWNKYLHSHKRKPPGYDWSRHSTPSLVRQVGNFHWEPMSSVTKKQARFFTSKLYIKTNETTRKLVWTRHTLYCISIWMIGLPERNFRTGSLQDDWSIPRRSKPVFSKEIWVMPTSSQSVSYMGR